MKKLYLGRNKKICGVCAGVGNYFDIDPTLIRIIVTCIALYTAVVPALVIYVALGFVFPAAPEDYVETAPARRLEKSSNKKISGVCGGFARYFNVDATLIRLAVVIATFFIGGGLTVYIVSAILMPTETITVENNFSNDGSY